MQVAVKHARHSVPTAPDPGRWRRAFAAPRSLLLVLLLALLVQGSAVRTHLHFAQDARQLGAAAGNRPVGAATPYGKATAPDCLLCQESASAGAYLLSRPVSLPSASVPDRWLAVAAMAAYALRRAALGWQSRAPPR